MRSSGATVGFCSGSVFGSGDGIVAPVVGDSFPPQLMLDKAVPTSTKTTPRKIVLPMKGVLCGWGDNCRPHLQTFVEAAHFADVTQRSRFD